MIVSEATLFCFGAVIFLIAFTGAILYGMSATEQRFLKETKPQTRSTWEVSSNGVINGSFRSRKKVGPS